MEPQWEQLREELMTVDIEITDLKIIWWFVLGALTQNGCL